MAGEFDWTIQNDKDFQAGIDRLGKSVSDFRIPFLFISNDFYKSQQQIFQLSSAGLYTDLSTKPFTAWWEKDLDLNRTYEGGYKEYKKAKLGFDYPILLGETGDLRDSTLGKSHKYSVYSLSYNELIIGSSVPYGEYHQSDEPRNKIPQRKFIFITGGKGDRSKDSGIHGRRERWLNIMNDHVLQVISDEVLK